jgi:hypothetical protein
LIFAKSKYYWITEGKSKIFTRFPCKTQLVSVKCLSLKKLERL